MLRYLGLRIGQGLLTVFLTVSTVFLLVRLAPGDPAAAYAGPTATTEDLERVRAQFGLDQPLLAQYGVFLRNLVQGDLGTSYSFQAPALDVVLGRLPYTTTLATSAILLTTVVAVPLGVWMARRADTMPRARRATWSPSRGSRCRTSGAASCCSPCSPWPYRSCPPPASRRGAALVLPTVTIAILQIALISRLVRREMVAALGYAVPDRGPLPRRLGERTLTWRYAMANSAIPVLTALGTRFAAMLNGVVVVEVVFSLARRRLARRARPRDPGLPADPGHGAGHRGARDRSCSCSSTSPTRCSIRGSDSER